MKNQFIFVGTGSLLALGLLAAPLSVFAADGATNTPAAGAEAPAHKHVESLPYHGKVAAVDVKAKTLTVNKLVLEVSSHTHIVKDGQPATLDQATVGEMVSGAYRKSEDGKLHAISIHIGAHTPKQRKPMEASTTNGTSTNGAAH